MELSSSWPLTNIKRYRSLFSWFDPLTLLPAAVDSVVFTAVK